MADESLSAFISVETDAPAAAAQLGELPGVVGRVVQEVNQEFARLGQSSPWARVISDSERAALSIEQVAAAAEASAAALGILNDANARLQAAGGTRITGVGGVSLAQINEQSAALERQIALLERERELAALPPSQTGLGGTARFTGGTAPGTPFISDEEEAAYKREQRAAAARNTLLSEARSTKPMAEDLHALTAVPLNIKQDFAAIANAMEEGAAAFEGKSIIAVRRAFQGVNGAIEPGFYNARTGAPVSAMDQLYLGGKSKFMAEGAGGGGGFFGGLGHGFMGEGGGGGFDMRGLGEQAGFIGRYVLIYQVFRDVERAIKGSVDQALAFNRAVTDFANRLGDSKEQARGLATQVGLVGAGAGLGPAETVNYAASFAGVFAGQAPQQELALQGGQLAAQIQVLTGKVKDDLPDVIAVVNAFNLSFSDTQRVLDAATSAAQNYGLANANAVLPGLAQIGDLAAQAGFSVEQTANAIADISTRTNDSSQAVAGELQRFLGREGNPAFQKVFSQLGINTTQPFNQELAQLSEQFDKLSNSQKAFITGQFGGGRAGVAALAFIEDYNKILGNTQKSLNEGGIAQRQYATRLSDIVGAINAVRGELKELAKDIGTSGLGTGFGIAIEAAKPFLELLDEAVRLLNYLDSFGGHFTLGRDLAIGAAEIAAAVKLFSSLGIGGRIGGIFGRRGGGAEEVSNPAQDAATAGLERFTAALEGATAAVTGDTAATEADAVAKAEDAVATEANAAAQSTGVLGRIGGALTAPAGVGSIITAAVVDAIVIQQLVDAESKIGRSKRAAQETGDSAFQGPNDPAALQDRAQALRQAAAKTAASSGGFFGTVENAIGAVEGRIGIGNPETTGDIASRDRVYARLLQTEAQRSEAAAAQAARGGDYSDQIDLTKQGGVDASLKNLAALGLDAGQQLDALNERLKHFAEASAGAASYLARGGAVLAAQNYANATTNNLIELARHSQEVGHASAGERLIASKSFIDKGAPGLNEAIDRAAADFLTPLEGGTISHAQQQQLGARVQAAMVDYLKSKGFSREQIDQLLPDIHEAANAALQEQIATINAAHGEKISKDAIGGVVKNLPNLITGVTQEVSTRAALGQTPAPSGVQVAGLQAAQAQAQATYNALIASGAGASDLQPVKNQLDALQVQLVTATEAHLQAMDALAQALIPSENGTDRLLTHLADLQAQLAATSNPDEILKIRTDITNSAQQLAASRTQDAVAAIGVNTFPADTVQVARNTLTAASTTLASYQQRGVDGQALSNAEKAVTQARFGLAQAEAADARSQRDSTAPLLDKVTEAYNAYLDTLSVASLEVGGQRANDIRKAREQYVSYLQVLATEQAAVVIAATDPRNDVANAAHKLTADSRQLTILQQNAPGDYTDIANLERQVAEDRLTLLTARITRANARSGAVARAGDPLAQARVQLSSAQRSLEDDLRGTTQYYDDLRAVHEAEAALASTIADRAKQNALLRGDTTDPVAQALATLVAARTKMAQDQARKTGDLGADQLAVEEAQQAAQKAVFDQQLANQQSAYDLHRESAGQYLQFLRSQDSAIRNQLSGMKKGAEGYQQLVDELNQIDSLILGLNSQVQGQFNLGSIKVPSIYEVRRSIAETQQQVIDASTTNNNVTLNGVDIQAVLAYINSILGVGATGSRAPVATRKAA